MTTALTPTKILEPEIIVELSKLKFNVLASVVVTKNPVSFGLTTNPVATFCPLIVMPVKFPTWVILGYAPLIKLEFKIPETILSVE